MLLAKRKRRENIAEYILYIWQLEDLMRALALNPDKIYSALVAPHEADDNKKQEIFFWYISIVNLLKEERKEQAGHNCHTLQLIGELNILHASLLQTDSKYAALHKAAVNDLEDFRNRNGNHRAGDVETSFDALYMKLLLNMKHQDLSQETNQAFQRIGAMVAYLAAKFRQAEEAAS
ncbi:MAG: DUF4924 family protein [Prevotellaceae bacterium]|jgi:hypothetical protein|nr:DUF4924 family protein [Prevotellaceae bacterium]